MRMQPFHGLLPITIVPRALGGDRVDWIDSARGAAIVLVVLLHAHEAAIQLARDTGGSGGGPVGDALIAINHVLRQLRLPLFYFCSGVLAHWGLAKPWSVVLRRRVFVLAWVIVVWTAIYFALQPFMPINPWGREAYRLSQFVIVPFGILWFLYAILFMSVAMRAVRPLGIAWQVGAVLLLDALAFVASKSLEVPGYDYFLNNLALYAIAFFALGTWVAPWAVALLQSRRRIVVLTVAAGALWLLDLLLAQVVPFYPAIPVALRSVPDVLFGVAFAALLTLWRPTRLVFTWLGSRTLEIFVLHPVFIAAGLLALAPFAPSTGTALAIMFPLALAGSLLVERGAKAAGLAWLFRPPATLPYPFTSRVAVPAPVEVAERT